MFHSGFYLISLRAITIVTRDIMSSTKATNIQMILDSSMKLLCPRKKIKIIIIMLIASTIVSEMKKFLNKSLEVFNSAKINKRMIS